MMITVFMQDGRDENERRRSRSTVKMGDIFFQLCSTLFFSHFLNKHIKKIIKTYNCVNKVYLGRFDRLSLASLRGRSTWLGRGRWST